MDFFGFFICVFCCSLQDLCFTDCIGIRFLCEFLQVFCFYVFDWSLQNMFYGFFVDFFRVSFLLWSFFLISSGIWFLCGFLPWGLFFSFFLIDFLRICFTDFFGIWFLCGFLQGFIPFVFFFPDLFRNMLSSWISSLRVIHFFVCFWLIYSGYGHFFMDFFMFFIF